MIGKFIGVLATMIVMSAFSTLPADAAKKSKSKPRSPTATTSQSLDGRVSWLSSDLRVRPLYLWQRRPGRPLLPLILPLWRSRASFSEVSIAPGRTAAVRPPPQSCPANSGSFRLSRSIEARRLVQIELAHVRAVPLPSRPG